MEDRQFKKQFRDLMKEELKDIPSFEESWNTAQRLKSRKPIRLKLSLVAAATIFFAGTLALFLWFSQQHVNSNPHVVSDQETWHSPTEHLLAGDLNVLNSAPLLNWESPTVSLMKPISLKPRNSILDGSKIK